MTLSHDDLEGHLIKDGCDCEACSLLTDAMRVVERCDALEVERDAALAENRKLREAVDAYLAEYDTPAPDPGERIRCRDRLRAALADTDDEGATT